MDVTSRIKNHNWDNRVARTGFLQSKTICNNAEILPVQLTPNVTVKYNHIFWIHDYNLYDEDATLEFFNDFKRAFEEDKDWPLKIIAFFDKIKPKVDSFVQGLRNTDWDSVEKKEKLQAFNEYVELLEAIQKHYVIAVPLTRYCEMQLKDYPEVLADHAVQYRELELDGFSKSNDPKAEFPWVKTAYNIIVEVTDDDIGEAPATESAEKVPVPDEISHLVTGLQVAIYTRNRMKELSQQIWYYFESLGKSMAKDFDLGRDDFFQLIAEEVIESYEKGKVTVSREEIKARHECFVQGYLDDKLVLLTGKEAKDLVKFFEPKAKGDKVSGTCACKGNVQGTVKVILSMDDFVKFNKGDILVTRMTTPDFVVIMGKAAAIVTDEGGLSCHAAIVSRELGVPCVIGTKTASKTFKDGDVVEVDADSGIVKKA
ncbi:PEP-utilizing enzyme [Nanoarchaeota archaeon]